MYDLITVNAGHSPYSTGASGNGYKEHIVARQIKDKVISGLKLVGQTCVDTTSNAKSASAVLKEQVSKCNSYHGKLKRRLDVSIHLNAGGGTGTEVLYYSQRELSIVVSREISNTMGWRDRGAKERKDLYFLSETYAPAILIEVCFIDSKEDMQKLMKNLDKVANAIVKGITGKTVAQKEVKEPVSKGKYFRVVTGSFKDRENAEKRVSELKKKGFDSFIDIYDK